MAKPVSYGKTTDNKGTRMGFPYEYVRCLYGLDTNPWRSMAAVTKTVTFLTEYRNAFVNYNGSTTNDEFSHGVR